VNWIAIGLIAVVFLVLLNVYATVTALRSSGFLNSQVRNQIILVWVLPVVGGMIVVLFHRSADDEDPRDDGGNSSDMTDGQLGKYWIGGQR